MWYDPGMGLFRKLFYGRSIEDDKFVIVQEMESMVIEAERVYRNLVQLYARDYDTPTPVSGRGLFKARLHATMFMVSAYCRRSPDRADDLSELLDIASAVAILTLEEPNSSPQLDRDEAATFCFDYLKRVFFAIVEELKTGPSLPNHQTEGFRQLVELYHDALRDSIGTTAYTPEVKKHFYYEVGGQINAGLLHLTEVVQKL